MRCENHASDLTLQYLESFGRSTVEHHALGYVKSYNYIV